MRSGSAFRQIGVVAASAAILSLPACNRSRPVEPPVRLNDPVPTPGQTSSLAVPIELETAAIQQAIEEALPRTLWTIDQHSSRCVKPQKVKIFGARIKVTPPISCTIVGTVTRGPVTLRGEGRDIVADLPIDAVVSARDIGGLLKGETATGSAMAHARIRLDVAPDWTPRGTVKLSYGWTEPPGIDFLGQRITFTSQAEEKLAPVLRKLEADLPKKLAKAELRAQVERLWRQGFTAIELNAKNPPVWMRISPRNLSYGGYVLEGKRLRLNLGMEAFTETFVGHRPPDPKPVPLPPLNHSAKPDHLRFFIPVVADYRELEPVLQRALMKRSRRPFNIPAIGAVDAHFGKVTIYGTKDGKIAVGLSIAVKPREMDVGASKGTVWLVARPVNAEGSARVAFTELSVTGDTDNAGSDLIIQLAESGLLTREIEGALTQNFTKDLVGLLDKIKRAIADKQTGDFAISARIRAFRTGHIQAFGQGLYLPVNVDGDAEIRYRPAS